MRYNPSNHFPGCTYHSRKRRCRERRSRLACFRAFDFVFFFFFHSRNLVVVKLAERVSEFRIFIRCRPKGLCYRQERQRERGRLLSRLINVKKNAERTNVRLSAIPSPFTSEEIRNVSRWSAICRIELSCMRDVNRQRAAQTAEFHGRIHAERTQ